MLWVMLGGKVRVLLLGGYGGCDESDLGLTLLAVGDSVHVVQ